MYGHGYRVKLKWHNTDTALVVIVAESLHEVGLTMLTAFYQARVSSRNTISSRRLNLWG